MALCGLGSYFKFSGLTGSDGRTTCTMTTALLLTQAASFSYAVHNAPIFQQFSKIFQAPFDTGQMFADRLVTRMKHQEALQVERGR